MPIHLTPAQCGYLRRMLITHQSVVTAELRTYAPNTDVAAQAASELAMLTDLLKALDAVVCS